MNPYIATFFIFGACFGWATFTWRHFFNEGPHGAESSPEDSALANRALWVLTCTFLWPIMALSGLNTVWIFAKRKRQKNLSH